MFKIKKNIDKSKAFILNKNTKFTYNRDLKELINSYEKDIQNNRGLKDLESNMITIKIDKFHDNNEAYKLDVSENLFITANTEDGVHRALQSLIMNQVLNEGIKFGNYIDYPDVLERRLHIDIGRKYFTKDWLIKLIKQLSFFKMNTIQLHFSENKGYRIESKVAPEIVSKKFLTFDEIKEIQEAAQKYGIKIIPSFDTPGHVEHILKTYPELGQEDIHGNKSTLALDITNQDAIKFVYKLLDEIMEIFSDSSDIHLGADEYMEFDRDPFMSDVMPYLNNYAKNTLGKEYNWKDAMATYINNLCEYVYNKGFKPRVWNDGMYYGEKDIPTSGGAPQKVKMHEYIGIDFWAQLTWNPSIATLNELLEKGFTDIYNVNCLFFYYVLRVEEPEDGRKMHSFDFHNQDRRIFELWSPGNFADNEMNDNDPRIKGVSMAIWNDNPNLVSEDIIWDDIQRELFALSLRSRDVDFNKKMTFNDFEKLIEKLDSYNLI